MKRTRSCTKNLPPLSTLTTLQNPLRSLHPSPFPPTAIGAGFLFSLGRDALAGTLRDNAVVHAIRLRGILTSLGPAYIKLGQALSIRPDVLPPAAMVEMQKLCDKVPSFDSGIAMAMLSTELGRPWTEVYAELTPEPVAAASLGQVQMGMGSADGDGKRRWVAARVP